MLLPGVKFTTLVYKLAAAQAFHTKWCHKTDSLLLGSCGFRALVAHDLRRIEIRGVAKGENWLVNAITSKVAVMSDSGLLFLQYLTFRHVGVGWSWRLFEMMKGGRWRRQSLLASRSD